MVPWRWLVPFTRAVSVKWWGRKVDCSQLTGGEEVFIQCGGYWLKGLDYGRNVRARTAGKYLRMKEQGKFIPGIHLYKASENVKPNNYTRAATAPPPSPAPLVYLPNEWSHSIWSIHPYLHVWTPVIRAVGITWGWRVGDSWVLRRETIQWRTSLSATGSERRLEIGGHRMGRGV